MSGLGSRRSLESQRDSTVAQLEVQKRQRRADIAAATSEQMQSLEDSGNQQLDQLNGNKAMLEGEISNMKSVLDQLPPGHPERGKVEKALKARQKALAQINTQINIVKFRIDSQKRLIQFRMNTQEKMIMIKFADQKSLLLRQFAERILQFDQVQQRMAAQQANTGFGGAKKKPAEAQESGKLAG